MSTLTLDNTFGGQLKKLRIKNELSIRDLSKALHKDAGNYCKIENGLHAPPSSRGRVMELLSLLPYDLNADEINALVFAAYAHHRNWLELVFETGEGVK